MRGIFAVYKPKGPTSYDIVEKIKWITGEKKVGHAGTLDPLARGILVIAVGREFTKKISLEVKKEKEYLAKIRLGENSATDDEEGKKERFKIKVEPDLDDIKKVVESFKGVIEQVPPKFSAVKVKGREAYKLARTGKDVELKSRKAEIKKIDILNYKWPYLKLRVVTGPGVYVRSLARDIGIDLGTGGYLYDLERIRVGNFTREKVIKKFQLTNSKS